MPNNINQSISLVSHIHGVTADFLEAELKKNGMPDYSTSHGNILFQLSVCDSMTMKDLTDKINRDKSTTTVLVRKLEAEGLVETAADEKDKRSKIIKLTQKGREYNKKLAEISKNLVTTFYAGFSEEEKQQFVNFLQRINKNFSK